MKKYIPSLNGLRAISILLVIFGHLNLRSLGGKVLPFPLSFLIDSSLGVNVFFVISGFLITRLLLLEEREYNSVSLKNFYIRRAFRIFPAYYFLLFVYFILQAFSILHFSRESWLSSIFYYKYFNGGAYTDWESGHFWSLSVEEHFYLVWPLVFILLRKQRVYFSYLVILAVMFFRLNVYYGWIKATTLTDSLSICLRADALMVGCLFALYEPKITEWVQKYRKSFLNPLALFIALLVISAEFVPDWNLKRGLHMGFAIVPLGIGTSIGLLSNLLVGLLMISSINNKGLWFKFLNLPFINYIGKLSYSLYLWQELFFSRHIGAAGSLPLNLFLMFGMAIFSYHIIERPFLKWKAKFETRRTTTIVPALTT